MPLDLRSLTRALNATDKIITPRLVPWLIQHGDDPVPEDIAKILHDIMTTPPRNRTQSFSGSSSGRCLREQELKYIGIPTGETIDSGLAAIFSDGKWRHLRWQAWLLMSEILTEVEFKVEWRRMRAKGSMDGLGVVPDDHPRSHWRGKEFGFELKGVFPMHYPDYKANGPKESHLNQVHRYFLVSGVELFVIVYEDKGSQDWCEWVIEPDPVRIEAQKKELAELNKAVRARKLHPMLPGCIAKTGKEWTSSGQDGCPYAGDRGQCIKAGEWPRIRKSL